MRSKHRFESDSVLAPLLAEARESPETLGIILHGSRGAGVEHLDSDYDVDWVLTDESYDRRSALGELSIPPVFDGERKVLDAEYTCPKVLAQVPSRTEWMIPAYASAQVLLDKSGELGVVIRDMVTMPEDQARAEAAAWYDAYLNAYYRGLKAAKRGNELGARLQAADSLMHLVRALFALERSWPPYHDRLDIELDGLESQGWETVELRDAFVRILRTGDPKGQQSLQRKVADLMQSRGHGHVLDAWGGEIDRVTRFQIERPQTTDP